MSADATAPITSQLLQSVTDGVLTLTLNRPEVLNAITPALLD
jgi:enoyl-CoA hydratase/carnithine racemase